MCVYIYIYISEVGGESNWEIVSFRCVRAGEAKLRACVRQVCLPSLAENRICLAVPGRAGPTFGHTLGVRAVRPLTDDM